MYHVCVYTNCSQNKAVLVQKWKWIMSLNIISLNTRGIRDITKRRSMFEFYRSRCDILCLQETHSTPEDVSCWTAEWGGKMVLAHGTSQSCGVAICVKKQSSIKIFDEVSDVSGRYAAVMITQNDVTTCLISIYAPNKDNPGFFDQVINLATSKCDKVIIVGDFNTVLNCNLDKKSGAEHSNVRSIQKIHQLMEQEQLCDIWRVRNPESRRYSWFKGRTSLEMQASRIDFGLVSAGICDSVHNMFYMRGIHSDHSAFFLGLELKRFERGSSYWKLNTSLLFQAEYVHLVNETIEKTIKETEGTEPTARWEVLKQEVKKVSMKYSRSRSSEEKVVISQLHEKILNYEESVDTLNDREIQLMNDTKIELDELLFKRVKGVMFRSKAKWAIEGEKNTKYFMNLEKAKYSAKTCNALFDVENDRVVTEAEDILNMQQKFYQNLYTSDPNVCFELPNICESTVQQESIAASENQFHTQEYAESVKMLKNGSCPGSDSLPVEFYKMFWRRISSVLTEALTAVYDAGTFYTSGRLGIVNVIPKGNKDTRYLKNLRPITLLNTDYKILEKSVANRMLDALQDVIHPDQKGFLPGRKISCNI